MNIRIGHGYDVHKLVSERDLILCGVKIPWHLGLAGHSDADVAVHALMDALLGAAALGDIGQWFPDKDPAFAGIDSTVLLEKILTSEKFSPYRIVNVDITIISQAPKLSPYREEMRQKMAEKMTLPPDAVSIKFTTTEKLGFAGRGEGIAADAVVLLQKN